MFQECVRQICIGSKLNLVHKSSKSHDKSPDKYFSIMHVALLRLQFFMHGPDITCCKHEFSIVQKFI